MNGLLRLYPRAWRDRYGAEFEALLIDRPPGVRDRLDIVRGALDARLRPQLVGVADEPGRPAWGTWTVAAAIGGGLLWVLASVALATQEEVIPWERDATITFIAVLLGALLLSAGPLWAVSTAPGAPPAARLLAPLAAVCALLMLAPWPILALGYYLFTVACLATAIVLSRADSPAWLLVVVGSLVNFAFNTGGSAAWLLVPFGLAWVVVALVHASPRPASVEPPPQRGEAEVLAR